MIYLDIVNNFFTTIIPLLQSNLQLMEDIYAVNPQLTGLPTGLVDGRIYSAEIDMQPELVNVYPRIIIDPMVSPIEIQQSEALVYDMNFIVHIYVPAKNQEYLGIIEGDIRKALVGQFINGSNFIGGVCVEDNGYTRKREPSTSPMLWHSELHLFLSATQIF